MSEKLYSCLIRLFPTSFQKAYGEEALQLFRDRAREEKGFRAGVRLWLDLLSDLVTSLPRSYQSLPAPLAVSRRERSVDGTPSFMMLEGETLSLGSLLYGGVTSLAVYGSICLLLAYGGNTIPALNLQQSLTHAEAKASPFSFMGQPLRHGGAITKQTARLTLTHTPGKLVSGAIMTVTATAQPVGTGPIPTGFVRLFDGGKLLDTGKLSNGVLTRRPKLPKAAAHILSAVYYGDDHYGSAIAIGEKGQR